MNIRWDFSEFTCFYKKNVVATFISRRIKISLTLSDDCGFNEKHFVKH